MPSKIFRGRHRSAWFPLLSARRFAKFDNLWICNLPCVNALSRLISIASLQAFVFLREKYDAWVSLPWAFCFLAFYIVTPGPAVTRTVCKYSTCGFLSRISYFPSCGFLRRRLTSRNLYAGLEKFLCFLQLSGRAYVSDGAWRMVYSSFDRAGTTGFKCSYLPASLLTVCSA